MSFRALFLALSLTSYFGSSALACGTIFVKSLGSGSYGKVAIHELTETIEIDGVTYLPRQNLAVKTPSQNRKAKRFLVNEAEMIERVAPFDPNGLFIRGKMIDGRLYLPYDPDLIMTLDDWFLSLHGAYDQAKNYVGERFTRQHFRQLESQLRLALKILKESNTVHGDLRMPNILFRLVDDQIQIKIIDFSLATPPGTFPAGIKARGQAPQSGPAAFSDDEMMVQMILNRFEPLIFRRFSLDRLFSRWLGI